jgi:hypothetical protein
MLDLAWIGSIGAGAICFGAGMLAWMKAPRSLPAGIFLGAMTAILFAMITAPLFPIVDEAHADIATTIAKVFVSFVLLALAMLWILALIFPIERKVSLRPLSFAGLAIVITVPLMIAVGVTTEVDFTLGDVPVISRGTSQQIIAVAAPLSALTTVFAAYSILKSDADGRRSASIFLVSFWLFQVTGMAWAMQANGSGPIAGADPGIASLVMTVGVAVSGLLFAVAIASGTMAIEAPVSEKLVSSKKAKFRLLHRYVYLVEEPKPEFSFKMFSDILKGRCIDCENDESFTCESLDCSACSLPCPCRECTKYRSRPQGLIVTRQYPKDVRAKYFLQTTPIIWLSTVAGADNMDPAKLSLLTDHLVNFMESSQNGVLVVDGLEYLITSNDFQRVLRAVDRWTETAMVSNSRLIMTLDRRSFDPKELAMIERNREVVRPDAAESWRIIPERI